jgi:CHAD domain-containing protein
LGEAALTGFAAQELKKHHRKVTTLAENQAVTAAERHRLRISIKRLRYVLDCFASLYPQRQVASMNKALADLQDALGHMNDQTVANRLIQAIDDGSADFAQAQAFVRGWLAAIGMESERSLSGCLEKLSAVKCFW